jgi:hypothetical protein
MRVRPRDRLALCFKKSLRDFQYDPVHWMELALAYAIIGKEEKADKAVAVALGLAQMIVLYSAARPGVSFITTNQNKRRKFSDGLIVPRLILGSWLLMSQFLKLSRNPLAFIEKQRRR